jgi:3-oxoacyl-[acyl-carrier protein] reductase
MSSEPTSPLEAFELTDRVAIVTGGGRGLGRVMALGLAQVGARVVVCGRNSDDLARAVQEIESIGGQAVAITADLAVADQIPPIVSAAINAFGGIDIIVNNAVDPAFADLEDIDPSFVERVLGVNLVGPLFLGRAALPYLEQSGHASVINVLSSVVFADRGPRRNVDSPLPSRALYRVSKEALWALTKELAKEWAGRGIRVNALSPGPFEADRPRSAEVTAMIRRATMLDRIAAAHEIVPPLIYIASDASRHMTSSVVHIDGGMAGL